jgi:transposase-like protein
MYDVDVSPDLISRVTDGVVEELQEWQSRPLDQGRYLAVVANH